MSNVEINFSKNHIDSFAAGNKLYSYIYNNLSKAYFNVKPGEFDFYLKGEKGMFKQTFPLDDYNDKPICFSLDFSKWVNALQKFSYADSVKLEISNKQNLIKLSTAGSSDVISLSIQKHNLDSGEVTSLVHYIPSNKANIESSGLVLELNDEVVSDLTLAGSLFVSQGNVNSTGLNKNGVIYADRATILKTEFKTPLPSDLFREVREEDGNCICLHQQMINLFPMIYKEDAHIYFSNDYGMIYWASNDKELIFSTDYRELTIPTDEQLEMFMPQNPDSYFSVEIEEFKAALNFFNGFYEGSVWKPITFISTANKEVVMRYRQIAADITKALPTSCAYDGTFILESESLRKVISKIKDKRENPDTPMTITFNFDEDAPGVLCKVGDYCNVIFAKLEDDSEI